MFTSKGTVATLCHPCFDVRCDPPIDFHAPLFDKFFQSEIFTEWSRRSTRWPLHCSGGPGSGKTTLAKAVGQALRDEENIGARSLPVAFVTIIKDVSQFNASIIGDIRKAIYNQLEAQPSTSAADLRGFLILDGYDRFDNATQEGIDNEISLLQSSGINVMTTGRAPKSFDARSTTVKCDGCQRTHLNLYWICRQCWARSPKSCYSFCCSCKEKSIVCRIDGHTQALEEIYDSDYREFPLDLIPEDSFRELVYGEMEKEYGSPIDQSSAPSRNNNPQEISKHLLAFMLSAYNITLVKAHMEEVHQMQSIDSAARRHDRLFPTVVSLYDSAIDCIEKQSLSLRYLGLFSIAAAAASDEGISLLELSQKIQQLAKEIPHLEDTVSLDPQRVFQSARGFLVVTSMIVSCYLPLFACYAREGYNKKLIWANEVLSHTKSKQSYVIPGQILDETHQTSSPPPISPPSTNIDSTDTSRMDSGYFSNVTSIMSSKESYKIYDNTAAEQMAELQLSTKHMCKTWQTAIVHGKVSSGTHTTTIKDLRLCAAEKCVICSSLWEDAQDSSIDHKELVYRWTVRSKPSFRESKQSMVVTFRRISVVADATDVVKRKIFHLVPSIDVNQHSTSLLSKTTRPPLDSFSQIRKWLHDCDKDHHSCRVSAAATWVPTRLVDVETNDPERVRIVDTKTEGICTSYATLSHCWGEKELLKLNTPNKERLMGEGALLEELPLNFKEAVAVTRHMGIKYIWIDSLCIIQDNGEFKIEGQFMHKVYRHSYCNISAADSVDSAGGLFRDRDPNKIRHGEFEADETSRNLAKGRWVVLEDDLWQTQVLDTNIYTRGWVYQERMLSPRILHFTRNQIFWDCCTLSASESLPSKIPFVIDSIPRIERHWRARLQATQLGDAPSGPTDLSLESFWQAAVLNYTSCKLTKQDDKTLAIWSIAKLVRDALNGGEEYVIGVWEYYLEEQLSWRVMDPTKASRDEELQIKFPSWSWASVKGVVKTGNRLVILKGRFYTAKDHSGDFLQFKATLDGTNPRDVEPKLAEKSLQICAHMKKVILNISADGKTSRISPSTVSATLESPQTFLHGFELFLDTFDTTTVTQIQDVHFLALSARDNTDTAMPPMFSSDQPARKYSGVGILLVQSSGVALESPVEGSPEGHYRRIGAVQFQDIEAETWEWIQNGSMTKIWLD